MAKSKKNEVAAGIVVVLSLVMGLGIVLWMGAADLFRKTGQEVYFFVPQSFGSTGLQEGALVTSGDERIGRVADIRLEPETRRCLYVVQLESENIRIRSDASAVVVAPAIGVPKLVVRDFGSGEKLANADHPVLIHGGLDRVMIDLAQISKEINDIARRIKSELDPNYDPGILAKVHTVVESLQGTSQDVAAIAGSLRNETDPNRPDSLMSGAHAVVADATHISGALRRETDANQPGTMVAKVHKTLDDVNHMTADANEIVSDAKPVVKKITQSTLRTVEKVEKYVNEDVKEILATVRETNTKILRIAANFERVSQEANQIVVLNRENIDGIIDDMAQVAGNLKATSKEVRRNPWRLIHKPSDKEIRTQDIYDAARAFSQGASEFERATSKLKTILKQHPDGVDPDDPDIEKIRKQVEESFRRYMKLEQQLWNELE